MGTTNPPPGCPSRIELERLAGGQSVDGTIAEHARSCRACSGSLAEIREREVFLRDFARMGEAAAPGADAQSEDDRQTKSFGGPRPADESSPVEGRGQIIGPYKLLELIGEGGFGSVFMAEQERPVRRRVALKIIKLGMDTRAVIARFEQERQAIAMMDHPNIAKVLDAGATASGRPYFVMELVRGESITKYCDRAKLTIGERLELFTAVCHAVQHAHTKGIIHRDIKPSNVLVTLVDSKPVPKVIDFGIAKATAGPLTDKTLFTEHRQMIGTPEYMSPEQAELTASDIDTRSDVYSLGVLLYELMTGVTPFDSKKLRSAAWGEMQRIIREDDPPRPSTRLTQLTETRARVATDRRITPERLGTLVRGDLDWIAMKCLEKDRTRRYETPSALADDLGRYLTHEPVLAAPPDAWYRLRKLARRHRMALLTAGFVGAALLTGVALMSYGLLQAQRERDLAKTAQIQAEDAGRRIEEQSVHARRVSDLLMSRFLRPVPFGENADAVARSVQKEAEEIFGVGKPEVSAMLSGVGAMLSTDVTREREAKVLLRRAMKYQEKSLGANAESLVMPYVAMASMTRRIDQPATLKYCREVLRLSIDSHGDESLASANAREALALELINGRREEDCGEILALYQRAIPVYEKELGDLHARTLDAKMACGQVLMLLNKFDESGTMMADAFEKARTVADTNPQIRFSTGTNLFALYMARKDKSRQVAMLVDLSSLATEVLGEGSDRLKKLLTGYAEKLRVLDETKEAERLEMSVRQMDNAAASPAATLHSAWAAFDTAEFARAQEKATELLETMPVSGPDTAPWDRYARFSVERLRIESMARAGHEIEAEQEARELLAATESRYGVAHQCTVLARCTLGVVQLAAPQRDDGVQTLRTAIQAALDHQPKDYIAASDMLGLLGDSLKDRGDADAASAVSSQLQALKSEWHAKPMLGGFDDDDIGAPPAGWFLRRDLTHTGMLCVVCDKGTKSGARCLRIGGFAGVDKAFESSGGFRNIMRDFDARPYRGKKVRFSAQMRLEAVGSGIASARLWMRADRPNDALPNMFDNMGDHPVGPGDWKLYEMTGVVDSDAQDIYVGIMVFGEATAWVDDVKFELVKDEPDAKP